MQSIIDFHCDLLMYLQTNTLFTAYDPASNCSIPQLRAGNVNAQIMAIFTETTPHSVADGRRQAQLFALLPTKYFPHFEIIRSEAWSQEKIGVLPAFENASGFCGESETLETGFNRLAYINENIGKVVYVSLTWNTENRFGGPQGSEIGIKPDGIELLRFLSGKNIAVDFSHASDRLAYDILSTIDREQLEITPIASHSNCRAIINEPRNLPDELIGEIVKREGVIGVNFVRHFLGDLEKQVDHLIKLGAEDAVVFGADFFWGDDPNSSLRKPAQGWYFPGLDNAACYPHALRVAGLDKMANQNALRFLKNKTLAQETLLYE